jgi:hypothetical protein
MDTICSFLKKFGRLVGAFIFPSPSSPIAIRLIEIAACYLNGYREYIVDRIFVGKNVRE